MNCSVHIFLLNEHFSPEYADANHNGQESENNLLYEWEDELAITSDVSNIQKLEDASFPLQGELPDGKPFNIQVSNMTLFEVQSNDGPTVYVGASKSIIDSAEVVYAENGTRINIFLKDYEPMSNPVPGIYIASKEFPKELIF